MSSRRLDPERAALLVIDVQEAFRKAVPGFGRVARGAAALVRGTEAMGMPIVVTEQYPKGLGRTAPARDAVDSRSPENRAITA